jgi:hypothetical protein
MRNLITHQFGTEGRNLSQMKLPQLAAWREEAVFLHPGFSVQRERKA